MEFQVDENAIYGVGVYYKGIKAYFSVLGVRYEKETDSLICGDLDNCMTIEDFSRCNVKKTGDDEYEISTNNEINIALTQL